MKVRAPIYDGLDSNLELASLYFRDSLLCNHRMPDCNLLVLRAVLVSLLSLFITHRLGFDYSLSVLTMDLQSSSVDESAFQDFHNKLKMCTLEAFCGREFVLMRPLREWFYSQSPVAELIQLDRLLEAAGKLEPVQRPNPTLPSHVIGKRGLILFSILLEIGKIQFLSHFWKKDFINSQLPLEMSKLKVLIKKAGVPDASIMAREFYDKQWKYFPVTLRLHDQKHHEKTRIVPIMNSDPIKEGGTAELLKVEVLEDFVDDKLKAEVPQSRFFKNDGLGHVRTLPKEIIS